MRVFRARHIHLTNMTKTPVRTRAYQVFSGSAMIPRRLTSSRRPLPDFLIIGAQKCGTASLFAYLTSHPSILRSFKKEVHFFDCNYPRGESWYRAFFPLDTPRMARNGGHLITGEASPYYLFHPHAARRAAETVPDAKLIVLLRDPVRRAFSQYRHRVRAGQEVRSFEEVLEQELERFPSEHARMLEDENYESVFHRHCCYLARGQYVEQLENWSQWFPRESMLIIRSEALFDDTAAVYARALSFLGIVDEHIPSFEVHNRDGSGARIDQRTEGWLRTYFAPYNRALYTWLGENLGW
jgi:hypothetical protein